MNYRLIVFLISFCFSFAWAEPTWTIVEKDVLVASELKLRVTIEEGVESFAKAPEGDVFLAVALTFGLPEEHGRTVAKSAEIVLEAANGFTAQPFGQLNLANLSSDYFQIQRPNFGDRAAITNLSTTLMFCVPKSVKPHSVKIAERKIELPAPTAVPIIQADFPKVEVDDIQWMHNREAKNVPSEVPFGTRLCIHISPVEGGYYALAHKSVGLITELGQYHTAKSTIAFDKTSDLSYKGELGKPFPISRPTVIGEHFVFEVPSTAKQFILTFNGGQIARGKIPPYTGPKRPAYRAKSKVQFKVHGVTVMKDKTITIPEDYSMKFPDRSRKKATVRYQPVLGGSFVKVKLEGNATYSTGSTALLGRHGGITDAFGYIDYEGKPKWGTYGKGAGPGEVFFALPRATSGTAFALTYNDGFDKNYPPVATFKIP